MVACIMEMSSAIKEDFISFQGLMKLTRDHVSGLVYSRTNKSSSGYRESGNSSDWTCPNTRCNFVNFAKRNECFRCTTLRHQAKHKSTAAAYESAVDDDGSTQVGTNPCNTIILRGLDALTTEETLLTALAKITSLEPKNCYVMRNFTTGVSMGYGFMEFETATDGRKIREHFHRKQSFEVDGKIIMVDYAKNTYSTILASLQYQNMGDQSQQSYDYEGTAYRQPTEYELQAIAASSANSMNSVKQQADQYGSTSAATTAAYQPSAAETTSYSTSELPQYPDPDPTQYVWDEQTGYYYDHSTGLYYDANSQYYYNMTTQEFMYWDHESKTYRPVPSQDSNSKDSDHKEQKKQKAKNIAKEMEKWAKSQNKKSKSSAPAPMAAPVTPDITTQAATAASNKQAAADMAYDVLMGNKKFAQPQTPSRRNDDLMPPPSFAAGMKRPAPPHQPPPQTNGLVASYGDGDYSDDEDDAMNEANHIDRQKLTCNLCERKFNSTAILEKHISMSDLHKENLAKLQSKSQGQFTKQYRDRAKERRLKEGNTGRAGGFLHPQRV